MSKKHYGYLVILVAILTIFTGSAAYSSNPTVVELVEGRTEFIEVSDRNLNLIKTQQGVRVYTGGKLLDIKIDDGNVFVRFMEGMVEQLIPQELYFVLPSGSVYSMVLVPKGIPARTIILRVPKEEMSDALEWETSHSYIAGIKELIKAMYQGRPPRGFSVKDVSEERTRWTGVRQGIKQVYSGATLLGEYCELTNTSKEPVRFTEKEFYERGILAVSIERHEIKPGEKTELYIVRKTKAQREFEKTLLRQNPLDVLREGGEKGGK